MTGDEDEPQQVVADVLVEEPLDAGRKAVAWLCFALFVATFVPVPVSF